MLKSQFRGLKKLIEAYPNMLRLGGDHSFNPHVYLVESPVDPPQPIDSQVSDVSQGSGGEATSQTVRVSSASSASQMSTMQARTSVSGAPILSAHTRSASAPIAESTSQQSPQLGPSSLHQHPLARHDSMDAYRPGVMGVTGRARAGGVDSYYPTSGYAPAGSHNQKSPIAASTTIPFPNGHLTRLHPDAEEFEPSLTTGSKSGYSSASSAASFKDDYYSRERTGSGHILRHQFGSQVPGAPPSDRENGRHYLQAPPHSSYRQNPPSVPPGRPPSHQYGSAQSMSHNYQSAYRASTSQPHVQPSRNPHQHAPDAFTRDRERYGPGSSSSAYGPRERLEYEDRQSMHHYYYGSARPSDMDSHWEREGVRGGEYAYHIPPYSGRDGRAGTGPDRYGSLHYAEHHEYSGGGYVQSVRHRRNDPGGESFDPASEIHDIVGEAGGGNREPFYFSSHGERGGDSDRHMGSVPDMSYAHSNRMSTSKSELGHFHDFHLLPRELSIVDNDEDGMSGGDSRVMPYFTRDDPSHSK